ncbi:MAG: chemotaxis protein CheB [Desulfobacterales bacterium]|nr:chemotaxis protein CheB [Desulfobacterales bacterium]
MTSGKKDKAKPATAPEDDKAGNGASTPAFPIVGIGASAGGLAAFEAFFSGMPKGNDPNMAFVIVQHLAPDHKSLLTELIQRYTRMEVFEVEDGMAVRPNSTYIIPPGKDMGLIGGALQLLEPTSPRGQRMPIDYFFRTLAQDLGERAIGIILSGTGSDGTLGLRAIKSEGGMAMVQSPETTQFDGMPRSALATNLVDYALAPADMAAQIIEYAARAIPTPDSQDTGRPLLGDEQSLKKIFILIRTHAGHDFSKYKPSTVHRRIERRMAMHQIESLDEYVRYLQKKSAEIDALFRDMLIGVTNFFRDPEAFKAIEEQVIPKLFSEKSAKDTIRVWTSGCSTGEEAYSLAILLAEHKRSLSNPPRIQVFATDIDSQSIATARAGLYPASIAADISPERLSRFFTREPGDSLYRINKDIRDMMILSEQNIIKDPPFSKLDLITCRNLMIYMGAELQKKIIPLFHYALNPGGFLFLGSSETVGEFTGLFTTKDRKAKIYQRKTDSYQTDLYKFIPPMMKGDEPLPYAPRKMATPGEPSLREITEKALLQQVSPAAALVRSNGDILYLHGRTGLYLEPAPGESAVNNILRMAREGFRRDLTVALRKAAAGVEIVRCPHLKVKTNGDYTTIDLTVRPLPSQWYAGKPASTEESPEAPLILVMMEQSVARPPEKASPGAFSQPDTLKGIETGSEEQATIAALRQELQAKEEYIETTNEELETANEELRTSNEEMQSYNEELQSANEELETSKEELQSVNEELSTVNAELEDKVADLTRANNDMNNLLAGTGIASVFVDHDLRILRFTPAATRIINLIQSDTGRPVGHLVSNLSGYDTLTEDTQAVLDNLITKEVEVQTLEGTWYLMRILPYRTLNNVIEGAVITFSDIHKAKQAQKALQEAYTRVTGAIVAILHEPALVLDADLQVVSANHAFLRTFQMASDKALGQSVYDLDNRRWDIPGLRKLLEKLLPGNSVVENYVLSHEFESIGFRSIRLNARMIGEENEPAFILLAFKDITGQENTEKTQ